MRVFPQQQNTGGFFITVLEKVKPMAKTRNLHPGPYKKWNPDTVVEQPVATKDTSTDDTAMAPDTAVTATTEGTVTAPALAPAPEEIVAEAAGKPDVKETDETPKTGDDELHYKQHGFKEDPYVFHETDGETYWPKIDAFYGFSKDFPVRNVMSRSSGGLKRNLYFVSDIVRNVIQHNNVDNLHLVNAGVKILTRSDAKNKPVDYRLCMEGLQSIYRWIQKQIAPCEYSDIGLAIRQEGATFDEISDTLREGLKTVNPVGCTVLKCNTSAKKDGLSCGLQVLVWKGSANVRTLVSKDDRNFLCMLLDIPNVDLPKPKSDKAVGTASESELVLCSSCLCMRYAYGPCVVCLPV